MAWHVVRVGYADHHETPRPGWYNSQAEAERAARRYDELLPPGQRHLHHMVRPYQEPQITMAPDAYNDRGHDPERLYQGTGGSVKGLGRSFGAYR